MLNKYYLFSPGDGSSFLSFRKGDLIVLHQEYREAVMNSEWCFGEHTGNGRKGDFPAECVYVLPTIIKPPPEILVRIIGKYVCTNTSTHEHFLLPQGSHRILKTLDFHLKNSRKLNTLE